MTSRGSVKSRSRFSRAVLSWSFLLSLCAYSATLANQWQEMAGPPGLKVNVIYKANGFVYAGTDNFGLYRSADDGITWSAANAGLERAKVRDVVAGDGIVLMAVTSTTCSSVINIYRSTDNGTTWTPTSGLAGRVITSLVVKGTSFYASAPSVGQSGIYRSTDNGLTWQQVPSSVSDAGKMFVSDNAIVVAAGNFIWRSVDDGSSWQLVYQYALSGTTGFARAGNSTVFEIGGGNLRRSTNNGASWTQITFPGGSTASVSGFGDVVYVGASGSVWRSADLGTTWTNVSGTIANGPVSVLRYDGTSLLAGTSSDAVPISRSTDGGASWSVSAAGLASGSKVRSLFAFGGSIFAGMQWDGIYSSADRGNTWTKADATNSLLTGQIVFGFASNNNVLYAGTTNGIYRSTNAGATFERVLNGFPPNIGVTAYSLTSSNGNIIAAVSISTAPDHSQAAIFYSTNNGDLWQEAFNMPADITGVTKVASDGGPLVYAGVFTQSSFTTGLYKSFDSGVHWVPKTTSFNNDITELAVNNNNVLASSLFTGYFSLDYGEGWGISPLPGSNGGIYTYALVGNSIYAGDDGMYVSNDGGISWTPIQDGFPTCPLPTVLASTADNRYLYAGTSGEGVWRRQLTAGGAAFDYDGDGRTDISVFRPSSGTWYLQRSTAGFSAANFGLAADKITPADFDGDGMSDIAVYRPSSGTWYILNSSNGAVRAIAFGVAEDLPTPADYDGDGRADISLFRPSSGTWYRLNSSDGSFYAAAFGSSEDRPTIGDFNGDGRSDLAVFRPSNATWYVARPTGIPSENFDATQFGVSTDLPIPADYDGDGRTDLAVYRASEGNWYLLRSASGFTVVNFGVATDLPAEGDFDGDGKADVSVFRPADGNWYRLNSSNGSFAAFQFGTNGDRPTPSAYMY